MQLIRVALWSLIFGCVLAGQAAPQLTETDKLRLEVRDLKLAVASATEALDQCQATLGPIRTDMNRRALQAIDEETFTAIEAAHPGYRVNRRTRKLEPTPEQSK